MSSATAPFTSLIILASEAKAGVEQELLAVLEPFSLTVVELQKIELRGRLILGLLIQLDPAHALAIEADLIEFAERTGYDVAMDYSEESQDSQELEK